MHSELITLFKTIAPINEKEQELIIDAFKPSQLKKGDFFLKSGEVNKYIGYIKKGLVRYFVYKDHEEATFEFTREGEFIADYQSFNHRVPSQQNIQAIEDCELLLINYQNVQNIFNNTPNGNLIGRVIIEHRFDVMVNQLLSIYMHGQQERYTNFVKNYSSLNQRIPQYLIASYVGIKPQSLSRIRRRFAKGIS